MLGRIRGHMRGNAVGYVALFVALGGTSVAAGLAANSVGTKQLKNNAVTTAKIKGNAVISSKVKNGSLRAADFAAGQLPSGAQGPKGDTGAPGAPGASGTSAVDIVVASGTVVSGAGTPATSTATAACPTGRKVLGGGAEFVNILATVITDRQVISSKPVSGPPEGWSGTVEAAANNTWRADVYAICG